MLNYAVIFYKEGKVVSLVVGMITHGIHDSFVGGVDREGDASGAVPGLRLVSFKVCDTRIGTMELVTGAKEGNSPTSGHDYGYKNKSTDQPVHSLDDLLVWDYF